MRILDEDTDSSTSRVTLFLTRAEAAELKDSIGGLLERDGGHEHVSDFDSGKELTVCLYEIGQTEGLHERSIKIIETDT